MTLREIKRYATLVARLSRAEEILESIQNASRPGSATSSSTRINATKDKDKVGNLLAEIEDLQDRIAYLKREIDKEKRKLNKFIDKIVDERVRMALRLKYFRDITWWQVADILGENYNEEGVKKLCYKYLEDAVTEDPDDSQELPAIPDSS